MTASKRKLIVIGGPTASGKSALALAVAEQFGGTVINADSMQVYDGLAILTNRPDAADEARAPHRLFGEIPPEEACSAGHWRAMAVAACDEAWTANRIPVVVGGTGLYLRALIDGIAPIPDVPQAGARGDARAGSRNRRTGAARETGGARRGDGGEAAAIGQPARDARLGSAGGDGTVRCSTGNRRRARAPSTPPRIRSSSRRRAPRFTPLATHASPR